MRFRFVHKLAIFFAKLVNDGVVVFAACSIHFVPRPGGNGIEFPGVASISANWLIPRSRLSRLSTVSDRIGIVLRAFLMVVGPVLLLANLLRFI